MYIMVLKLQKSSSKLTNRFVSINKPKPS